METFISKEIQAGLDMARLDSLKKSSRFKVTAGEDVWPVIKMWKTGFALEAGAPPLRGFVDLYQGTTHLFQCLIVACEEDAAEVRFEFKRATAVAHTPAVDFEIDENAPVALIDVVDLTEGR